MQIIETANYKQIIASSWKPQSIRASESYRRRYGTNAENANKQSTEEEHLKWAMYHKVQAMWGDEAGDQIFAQVHRQAAKAHQDAADVIAKNENHPGRETASINAGTASMIANKTKYGNN